MPLRDGVVEGFAWDPGANANYRAGRIVRPYHLWEAALHFTVGRCGGDRSVGKRGYFQAYAPRERGCGPGRCQFAQVDALCWHMCEHNPYGPGIEFERWDWNERLTDYQIESGGLWINTLIELGVPDRHIHTGKHPPGTPGFVNHAQADIRRCDPHSDGITHEEYMLMREAGGVTGPMADDVRPKAYIILGGRPT